MQLAIFIFGTILCALTASAEKITVTTIVEPPYVIEKSSGSGNDKYEGFIPDMLDQLMEKVGLEYDLVTVGDGMYGQEKSNGQWNGMIGEVKSGKAVLAAAPITVSERRQEVVDFTEPFMEIETTILALKPKEGETLAFSGAKELSEQSEIKYGVVKDGMTQNFFKNSQDTVYRKMYEAMMRDQSVFVKNNERGVQRVRDSAGKFAFIIESSTADYWINRKPCDLTRIDKLDGSTNRYGFVLEKNSRRTQELSDAIKEMKESGEIDDLKEKWWKGDCSSSATFTSASFMVSMVGMLLARLF